MTGAQIMFGQFMTLVIVAAMFMVLGASVAVAEGKALAEYRGGKTNFMSDSAGAQVSARGSAGHRRVACVTVGSWIGRARRRRRSTKCGSTRADFSKAAHE